jgi:hypothetical protein
MGELESGNVAKLANHITVEVISPLFYGALTFAK